MYESDDLEKVKDDMERMRARLYRVMEEEGSLLQDGLDALRKGKVHVTEDVIERVLSTLEKEMKKIE